MLKITFMLLRKHNHLLLSLTVEEVLFLDQIFEVETLLNLHVLRFPETENHIFSI